MKIIEIGTGYTAIPAKMGAATEIVVEQLVKAFDELNQDVELVDIADKNRLPNELPIKEVKIPFFSFITDVQLGIMHKIKRVVYSIALVGKLKKIINESEDRLLLHFHNQYNLFFFLKLIGKSARKKVEIAYTVHSYIWPTEWEEIKEIVKKRYFQEVYCVQKADYVLVLNDKTKEHFIKYLGVDSERIHRVMNGVNTDVYSIMNECEIEKFKKTIGLSNKRVIFQVGSVCDRKNQFGVVQMLANYLKEHRNVVYMYAGGIIDTDYKNRIDDFSKKNGIDMQVKYVGELCPGEELNKYYNLADATLFPSKIESFGLVVIESLSAGIPVFLLEKPIFELDGGYSLFHSGEELIHLVENQIGSSVSKEKNRREVIDKYSWNAVARQHVKIFNL